MCPHGKTSGGLHCAEMSCRNYVSNCRRHGVLGSPDLECSAERAAPATAHGYQPYSDEELAEIWEDVRHDGPGDPTADAFGRFLATVETARGGGWHAPDGHNAGRGSRRGETPPTLAERGAIGHRGQDDYRECMDERHWNVLPQGWDSPAGAGHSVEADRA